MHAPEILRQLLRYEPDTGLLYWRLRPRSFFKSDRDWKRWNNRYAGNVAFRKTPLGYVDGYVLRKMHRAHRVAWVMYYGEEPLGEIDHINGVRDDNRISNLRDVTKSENQRNTKLRRTNSSGVLGVSPLRKKWRATIKSNDGKQLHLGVFDKKSDAVIARKTAEICFGYHKNHGRISEPASPPPGAAQGRESPPLPADNGGRSVSSRPATASYADLKG